MRQSCGTLMPMTHEHNVDDIVLEVLSFFEDMTFEKMILDWPEYASVVTREELESALERLLKAKLVEVNDTDQGPAYKKIFKSKKKWWHVLG